MEKLQLSEIAAAVGSKTPLEAAVNDICTDTRKLEPGCLFLALRGANFDGHQAAAEAAEKKAAAIIVSQEVELPKQSETTLIRVEDTRYALAFVSAAWFDHPAKKLTTIGITGTKGKTTTTYLVKSILENAGRKVGLVGTIEIIIGTPIVRKSLLIFSVPILFIFCVFSII